MIDVDDKMDRFVFNSVKNTMTKELAVIILGAWVALVPFLGFPHSWDAPLLLIVGCMLVVLGFLVRNDRVRIEEERSDAPASSVEFSHVQEEDPRR